MQIEAIAHIHTDYPEKFGIPRQSGLVTGLPARVVFEKEYRRPESVRGLEGFSHVWLIWHFSEGSASAKPAESADGFRSWSPTVRPPRLGGNKRVGVFATRSPNRPNPIGLSAVKLLGIDYDCEDAPVLIVDGADMLDGTPVFDIKPYLPFADSIAEASDGFAGEVKEKTLVVVFFDNAERELKALLPEEKIGALKEILSQSPAPGYKSDPDRVYGLSFAGVNVSFKVSGGTLTVTGAELCRPHSV